MKNKHLTSQFVCIPRSEYFHLGALSGVFALRGTFCGSGEAGVDLSGGAAERSLGYPSAGLTVGFTAGFAARFVLGQHSLACPI